MLPLLQKGIYMTASDRDQEEHIERAKKRIQNALTSSPIQTQSGLQTALSLPVHIRDIALFRLVEEGIVKRVGQERGKYRQVTAVYYLAAREENLRTAGFLNRMVELPTLTSPEDLATDDIPEGDAE
jgi:hypothetical protein